MTVNRKITGFCAFLMLVLSSNGMAQSAEEFVKEIQQTFAAYTTYQASFIQSGSGMSGTAGKFIYKKNNKMRIEMPKMTLISDGVTVWNVNKKDSKVVISRYNEKDASLFSIPDLIEKYPANCTPALEKTGKGYILTLTPKDKKQNFKLAKLNCNAGKTVTSIQITDLSGNKITITLSEPKTNKKIDDAQFSFSPKEGIKIIDLR